MHAPRPVVLCILDGWGHREERTANAVALAGTPAYDRLMATCPHALLAASGRDVGLPEGQIGNSEVGHMNIGAGRVVWMDLPRIDAAIEDGSFDSNATLQAFITVLMAKGGRAHVAGLLSPGGVHSHERHFIRAIRAIAGAGVEVVVHAFLDGRDVAPKSAGASIAALEAALPAGASVGSVSGRFYAMDRDNRWDRVEAAYRAIALGKGRAVASAAAALAAAYDRGESDEFVEPSVVAGYAGAAPGDGLLFINFRSDRARELLSALLDPEFGAFPVPGRPEFSAAAGMVSYSARHDEFMDTMFAPQKLTNTLGEWVAARGRRQLRLAETEKYPHVTFFMNGGVEVPNPGEDRRMSASPKVRTYDLKPEMSAEDVADNLVAGIESGAYDLILVNFANPDMVGHTGSLEAAIRACEAVDAGVARALAALEKAGGAMLLTADHGNCEIMVDPVTGEPHTAHTLSPVPVVLFGGPPGARLRDGGRLADLAPTLLALMGLPQPPEMTGRSLLAGP
jgi:2,3-bisphosphoglycerate-independent phosphoglycerate mutase